MLLLIFYILLELSENYTCKVNLRGRAPKPKLSICDAIKQNESEVKKYDFCFLAFSIRVLIVQINIQRG